MGYQSRTVTSYKSATPLAGPSSTLEKRFISYIVVTLLVFMFLFFAGVAPDVMKDEGANWVKPSWQQASAEAGSGHATSH